MASDASLIYVLYVKSAKTSGTGYRPIQYVFIFFSELCIILALLVGFGPWFVGRCFLLLDGQLAAEGCPLWPSICFHNLRHSVLA
jgi:hypothetical protein